MFFGCKAFIDTNLSSFKNPYVKNMSNMFSECSSLQIINLSSLTSEKLQNISNMFKGCTSLKEVDFSSFKIETTDYCCYSIQDINMQNIFEEVPSSCKIISDNDKLKDQLNKCFIF